MYHVAWESLIRRIRYKYYSKTMSHDKLPSITDLYSDKCYINPDFQCSSLTTLILGSRNQSKKEPKTFEEFIKDKEGTCI